jgi:hypothetical protein
MKRILSVSLLVGLNAWVQAATGPSIQSPLHTTNSAATIALPALNAAVPDRQAENAVWTDPETKRLFGDDGIVDLNQGIDEFRASINADPAIEPVVAHLRGEDAAVARSRALQIFADAADNFHAGTASTQESLGPGRDTDQHSSPTQSPTRQHRASSIVLAPPLPPPTAEHPTIPTAVWPGNYRSPNGTKIRITGSDQEKGTVEVRADVKLGDRYHYVHFYFNGTSGLLYRTTHGMQEFALTKVVEMNGVSYFTYEFGGLFSVSRERIIIGVSHANGELISLAAKVEVTRWGLANGWHSGPFKILTDDFSATDIARD